jgi:hypothetical protein
MKLIFSTAIGHCAPISVGPVEAVGALVAPADQERARVTPRAPMLSLFTALIGFIGTRARHRVFERGNAPEIRSARPYRLGPFYRCFDRRLHWVSLRCRLKSGESAVSADTAFDVTDCEPGGRPHDYTRRIPEICRGVYASRAQRKDGSGAEGFPRYGPSLDEGGGPVDAGRSPRSPLSRYGVVGCQPRAIERRGARSSNFFSGRALHNADQPPHEGR